MKIHEYQAKELLKKYGVAVPKGRVASTVDEVTRVAEEIGFPVVIKGSGGKCNFSPVRPEPVEGCTLFFKGLALCGSTSSPRTVIFHHSLKAQIHAGGRGKGGGIKVAKTVAEAEEAARKIIGMNLVTHQTGPEGKIVKKVLVEKASDIVKEFYLGMVLDRARSQIVMMASQEGGVEIEEVAHRNPEKIFKTWIEPQNGLQTSQAKDLGERLGLSPEAVKKFATLALNLHQFYVTGDATLAEINPLALTKQGDLFALDAKINFDDNALFRHKELAGLLDPDEEDPNELEAKEHGLNYVSLNGNIGCLVNGAGLAMATMDIIKLAGGAPCNFLDVGGGASQESVTEAFKLILKNTRVKAIFVNIFGGILRCDMLATGIVAAAKEIGVKVPLVVRLLGTNVDQGKEVLKKSGLKIISEDDFTLAAKKVVEATK